MGLGFQVLYEVEVTIANGASLSSEAVLTIGQGFGTLVGIILPAALTNTSFSFLGASSSGGTFTQVYDEGGASIYSVTVGASRRVPVNPRVFAMHKVIKIQGGTVGSPVTEGGARTITLVYRTVE